MVRRPVTGIVFGGWDRTARLSELNMANCSATDSPPGRSSLLWERNSKPTLTQVIILLTACLCLTLSIPKFDAECTIYLSSSNNPNSLPAQIALLMAHWESRCLYSLCVGEKNSLLKVPVGHALCIAFTFLLALSPLFIHLKERLLYLPTVDCLSKEIVQIPYAL